MAGTGTSVPKTPWQHHRSLFSAACNSSKLLGSPSCSRDTTAQQVFVILFSCNSFLMSISCLLNAQNSAETHLHSWLLHLSPSAIPRGCGAKLDFRDIPMGSGRCPQ